jgi:hypothetical protein
MLTFIRSTVESEQLHGLQKRSRRFLAIPNCFWNKYDIVSENNSILLILNNNDYAVSVGKSSGDEKQPLLSSVWT